nr:unnamed protein product [Spirometra erinaceieuropaei]
MKAYYEATEEPGSEVPSTSTAVGNQSPERELPILSSEISAGSVSYLLIPPPPAPPPPPPPPPPLPPPPPPPPQPFLSFSLPSIEELHFSSGLKDSYWSLPSRLVQVEFLH